MSTVTFTGTAATGKALANATTNINCAQGSISVGADANGNYQATLGAVLPCMITATSGGTVLHSAAFAGGTYNVTPETELLLSYLAAQLGTNESGLIGGFTTNTRFQQALASQGDVLAAQAAVVQNLQQTYGVTLSTPNFLVTPFAVGQPGVDSDLRSLLARGAIDANGEPRRTYEMLKLERDRVLFLPLTWTVVHPIDSESPLWGKTAEDIERLQAEVLILIKGHDDTFNQTVTARHSYRHNEMVWGARFAPAFSVDPEGDLVLELRKVGELAS